MLLDELLKQNGISTKENKTADLLTDCGLNWEVQKEGLILPSGQPSGFYGIVRQDTQKCFATCKEAYTVFQNSELLNLVNEAAGNLGLSVTKGGLFKGGALVYLQLETGTIEGIGKNNDSIKKYVSAMNSHDGSLSLKWGLTNITISCQNTFWSAVRDMNNSVRHTDSMHSRIDNIINQITAARKVETGLYETFFKFAEIQMTKEHIKKAVKVVLDIDMTGGKKADLTPYQMNRLNDLSRSIEIETAQKGATLWGLFSGVTNYTTHKMPGGKENRLTSKAIGNGFKVDNNVFTEFAELIN